MNLKPISVCIFLSFALSVDVYPVHDDGILGNLPKKVNTEDERIQDLGNNILRLINTENVRIEDLGNNIFLLIGGPEETTKVKPETTKDKAEITKDKAETTKDKAETTNPLNDFIMQQILDNMMKRNVNMRKEAQELAYCSRKIAKYQGYINKFKSMKPH